MNKEKINLDLFEKISDNEQDVLLGGFSKSYSKEKDTLTIGGEPANNCWHGNCIAGCGGNTGCNTVAGCGA